MKTSLIALTVLIGLLEPIWARPKSDFYGNSVTLNGRPVNTDTFVLNRRGVLALVEGDPRSPKPKPVSFRVTLRRNGTAVGQWPSRQPDLTYALQLDEVWPSVRFGDELVIESADRQIRRVIWIKTFNWLTINEGC